MDEIKRERANFGRVSGVDVSSGQRFALRQNEQLGNALLSLGQSVARNSANNKNAAWQTYLQTRAVKLKAELAPALQSQSDFEGIDAQMKAFDEWDKNTRAAIMGGQAVADKYWNENGQGTLLSEQTAIMANAAKLNLTNAQAARETDDLIKATAQNYALTKDKNTQEQIDAGFLKEIEETKTYSQNGLVMRARTQEEVNKIYDAYKKTRDTKVNENDYLTALNLAAKQPENLYKTILNPKEWKSLTNQQREHLHALAQRQIEARKDTFLKNNVQMFNDYYARIAETAPQMAKDLLNDMLKNPASRETGARLDKLLGETGAKQFLDGIKGLDKNDFDKVLSGWEIIAANPDTVLGLQQISAMGQIELENSKLGYRSKDGDIELVDKAASEAVDTDGILRKLNHIQNNYAALTNRKLKTNANKIIENFKSHLGASVKKDTGYIEERGFFMGMLLPGTSRGDKLYGDIDEYIKDKIVTSYPTLSDAEIGEAYYRFRKNAEKNALNLNDNSTAGKAAALKLMNNIMAQDLAVKYNAPSSAQNILADGEVIPFNPNGEPAAGQSAGNFNKNLKTIDSFGRVVEIDENGKTVNIYDSQRY